MSTLAAYFHLRNTLPISAYITESAFVGAWRTIVLIVVAAIDMLGALRFAILRHRFRRLSLEKRDAAVTPPQ